MKGISTRLWYWSGLEEQTMSFETVNPRQEGAVLFADIAAPPMNLLGPELVRDLVSLIQQTEADPGVRVLVFRSADRDYFIAHVDVTRIGDYREQAARLTGEPSIALLFRRLSSSRLVTIAQIEGRVRGAGSEFVLACDMRFAARESAVFGQPEQGFGLVPGAGAVQHLVRLMGRGRALEVLLSARDYDADLAERYGWINRALPATEISGFVASLAHRVASFPAAAQAALRDRVNSIALAPAEDFRRDSDLFVESARHPEAQGRMQAAMKRGFQTRGAEMDLGDLIGELWSAGRLAKHRLTRQGRSGLEEGKLPIPSRHRPGTQGARSRGPTRAARSADGPLHIP
jgi:enoyl-CoA hydratase/carnithine racemase